MVVSLLQPEDVVLLCVDQRLEPLGSPAHLTKLRPARQIRVQARSDVRRDARPRTPDAALGYVPWSATNHGTAWSNREGLMSEVETKLTSAYEALDDDVRAEVDAI